MNRFPLSIDLTGQTVFLIGNGEQIRAKAEKLAPFGAVLVRRSALTPEDVLQKPAMVIVGDTPMAEAEQIHALCAQHRIPLNVVDVPRLCSFHFPALITCGSLTVSVSTGGSSPAAAACLRRVIEQALPDNTEAILDWAAARRPEFRELRITNAALAEAFAKGRPLTEDEIQTLAANQK